MISLVIWFGASLLFGIAWAVVGQAVGRAGVEANGIVRPSRPSPHAPASAEAPASSAAAL